MYLRATLHDEGLEDVVRQGSGVFEPALAQPAARNRSRVIRAVLRVWVMAEAEELAVLDVGRLVGGVDLEDQVGAVALGLEQLEGFRLVARSDEEVADLVEEQPGQREVDDVAYGRHVAERAHTVAAAGACVGGRQRRVVLVAEELRGAVARGELAGDRGAGGTYVLERRGGRFPSRHPQLAHQLPGAERVEEVDVPWPAAEHLEAGLLRDRDAGRRLVRVAAVLQGDLHRASFRACAVAAGPADSLRGRRGPGTWVGERLDGSCRGG